MHFVVRTSASGELESLEAAEDDKGFMSGIMHPPVMFHRDELVEPLGILPPVQFAFSYGSGVFAQSVDGPIREEPSTETAQKPMVDYILGVSSPSEWHSKVSGVADNVGVGVHFNPFVPWKDKTIKYGVIGLDKLKEDIVTWKTLYISGRLQKPVSILLDTEEVKILNLRNLKAALYAAMLLAPPEFTEEELYMNICSLSYLGDIRMFFAEDKRKVQKIVRGSADRFQEIYRALIHDTANSGLLGLPASFGIDPHARLVQSCETSRVATLIAGLPKSLLARLAAQTGVIFDGRSSEPVIAEAVAQSKQGHANLVRRAIGGIVRTSSVRQTVSGLFAAGGVNACHYLYQKTFKAWRSWIR